MAQGAYALCGDWRHGPMVNAAMKLLSSGDLRHNRVLSPQ